MATSAAALVVHDLKNELGELEHELERLGAAGALQRCQRLRQRFVMYLALYGTEGPLRAVLDDESPADLLRLLAHRHPNPRVPIRVDVADDAPPYGVFDRHLVAMALDAALHNALRFARSGVTLGVRGEGRELVFVVDDDGPGVEATAGDDDEGHATGLGTALCRAVAAAHGVPDGARVATRPGGGARFELRLAT